MKEAESAATIAHAPPSTPSSLKRDVDKFTEDASHFSPECGEESEEGKERRGRGGGGKEESEEGEKEGGGEGRKERRKEEGRKEEIRGQMRAGRKGARV